MGPRVTGVSAFSDDRPVRLLLDTNIWSRLVERGESEEFYQRMRQRRDIDILVAPATLLELQRDLDFERRRRAEMLVCEAKWTRLPTESRTAAEEVVAEVKRLRPEWIGDGPMGAYRRHAKFWATKIWDSSRRGHFDPRHPVRLRPERDEKLIFETQKFTQEQMRAAKFNIDTHGLASRLRESRATYDPEDPHWESLGWESSDGVETWRLENAGVWTTTLRRPKDEPFKSSIDWMEPFLNIESMAADPKSMGHMWLYEVDRANVPVNWLRWAVRFAQTAAKLEPSGARDEQLAAYIPHADLFITNDRRFSRILEAVVEAAPTAVAAVRHAGIKRETPSATRAIEALVATWAADPPT
jgi:predicted nucleic acid-binding protein